MCMELVGANSVLCTKVLTQAMLRACEQVLVLIGFKVHQWLGLVPCHSKLSLHLCSQHPICVSIGILVAALPSQIPSKDLGSSREWTKSFGLSAHMGNPQETPGFQLQIAQLWPLQLCGEWASRWSIISLSLSLVCVCVCVCVSFLLSITLPFNTNKLFFPHNPLEYFLSFTSIEQLSGTLGTALCVLMT